MSRNYLHPSRLSVFPLSIMVNIELVWSKEKLCRFDDASPRQPMRHESKNSYSRTVATASFAFFYFSPLNPFVSLPLRAFFFFFFSLFLSLYFFSFSKAIRDLDEKRSIHCPLANFSKLLGSEKGIGRNGRVRQKGLEIDCEAQFLCFSSRFLLVVWWIYDNIYVPSVFTYSLLISEASTDWI